MKLSPVKRVVLAAVISPLASLIIHPLVASLGVWVSHAEVADMADLFSRSPYGLFFLYPLMLVFGLPTYFVLWRLRFASIWVCAAIGFVGGAFNLLLIFFWFDVFLFVGEGRWVALGGYPVAWWYGVEGMLLGAVFWSIARPDLNPRAANQSASDNHSQASAASDDNVLNPP